MKYNGVRGWWIRNWIAMGIGRVLVMDRREGMALNTELQTVMCLCVGGSQKRVKGLNIVKVSSSTCRIDGGKKLIDLRRSRRRRVLFLPLHTYK